MRHTEPLGKSWLRQRNKMDETFCQITEMKIIFDLGNDAARTLSRGGGTLPKQGAQTKMHDHFSNKQFVCKWDKLCTVPRGIARRGVGGGGSIPH